MLLLVLPGFLPAQDAAVRLDVNGEIDIDEQRAVSDCQIENQQYDANGSKSGEALAFDRSLQLKIDTVGNTL